MYIFSVHFNLRHQRINMPETTCFIAPIASRDDLKNAITSIVQHNTSAFEPLGYYTDAEYEALDPRRFKKYKSIKSQVQEKNNKRDRHEGDLLIES